MPRTAQSAYLHVLQGNPNNKTKKELSRRIHNEERMQVSAKDMKPPFGISAGAEKSLNGL